MPLHLDNLFQFIVPLTFLAIWALTSLFNREAQPLPPRTGRPQPPNGPGMGTGMGTGGGTATLRGESLNRDPSLRWSSPTATDRPPARRPVGRTNDDILIIEDTRRPSGTTPARPSPGAAPRKGTRSRPVPGGTPKRGEVTSPRPLTGALGTPLPIPQQMSRQLELNPLAMPPSPLLGSQPQNITQTISEPTLQASRPVPVWDDFRLLLNSPAKLREAIIVNEILQPPLALRRRSNG
jgi:hypothetical protein